MDAAAPLFLIVGLIVAVVTLWSWANKKKRERLMAKYRDSLIVDRIMNRKVWEGMTKEQLIDSWGLPVEIGQKVYKTKITETYKYNQTGKNRFRSRVTIENDIVIGWQQK
jgi:hypothetical protein